jgi:hypothetical protein
MTNIISFCFAKPPLSMPASFLKTSSLSCLCVSAMMLSQLAAEIRAEITVHADQVSFRMSDMMIGANMEDLHYQMVGGIDSQLIHGESFFEPSPTRLAHQTGLVDGFANCGGGVKVEANGELLLGAATRLTSLAPIPGNEVSVELDASGRGGLALCVHPNHSDNKWEWYSGYSVMAGGGQLILTKAVRAAKPQELARAPLTATGWIKVHLGVENGVIRAKVNDQELIRHADPSPLQTGHWAILSRDATHFRRADGFRRNPLLETPGDAISLRWQKLHSGTATGEFKLETENTWHANSPSQTITFTGGSGEWGIYNAGLKRWGIHLVADKPYEGFIRAKSATPMDLWVSLRSSNGSVLAEQKLTTRGANGFEKIPFTLTPSANDGFGRFAVTLKKPGSATLGYVFLQPGEWGRFRGLPIRKDLAEALLAQGIRVLRFNGGMIEVPGYRWKNLRGPRDERPPYDGFYDRYCSSGFGPAEIVAFGKAAGIPVIPALNVEETPEEVADFIKTCRPDFYQHANETRFDRRYVDLFKPVAEAVWKVAPNITMITTSTGADIKDTDSDTDARKKLALHLELAEFARQHGKPILFDSHSFKGAAAVDGIARFARRLQQLAPDPKLVSVGILEFNAGAFDFQRGLNHALEMNAAHRSGDVIRAVGTPNVSQPWGVYQTDWKAVLWTQGNIYYTQDKVWFQAAYYVDRMIARHWAPDVVSCSANASGPLDIMAAITPDGKQLVLRAVNPSAKPIVSKLNLQGTKTRPGSANAEILAGDPSGFNTLDAPEQYKPRSERWQLNFTSDRADCSFPPHSFTILTLDLKP